MVSQKQIKAARVMLGWTQTDLARKSGVSVPTVTKLESSTKKVWVADFVLKALGEAGVVFIPGGLFLKHEAEIDSSVTGD